MLKKSNTSSTNAILTLSISCVSGPYLDSDYLFIAEISADAMLVELAPLILDMAGFDGDHLDAFYLASGTRGKKTFLTGEDDDETTDVRLSNIFPLPKNKKLFYLYDFGASWCFQITRKGKEKPAQADLEYPRIVETKGIRPEEYGSDDDME